MICSCCGATLRHGGVYVWPFKTFCVSCYSKYIISQARVN